MQSTHLFDAFITNEKASNYLEKVGMTVSELYQKVERYAGMLDRHEVIYAVTKGIGFSAM